MNDSSWHGNSLFSVKRAWSPMSAWNYAYTKAFDQIDCFMADLWLIHHTFWENVYEIDPNFPERPFPFDKPKPPADFNPQIRCYLFSPGLETLTGVYTDITEEEYDWIFLARKQTGFSLRGIYDLDEIEGYRLPQDFTWAEVVDNILIHSTVWCFNHDSLEGGNIPTSVLAMISHLWSRRNLVDMRIFGPNGDQILNEPVED